VTKQHRDVPLEGPGAPAIMASQSLAKQTGAPSLFERQRWVYIGVECLN
jgi:hypothetical protein